ncbi:NADP-dependent oxidoreductase [Ferroacidibacillus organovorans]|uniref:NADP-dependent oxidoreductase n=1 Tax=Ferroacidibacillus organovorans TaxID=1765683 RepID=A0A117SX87_9BACL|nr:NADP-dependent oxidoreductase [Ferroacidibacillus organovorans]KUO94893.1 NADP-dependent oxidoreductase [Ferroacidibacillus organovorans]
MNRQVIFVKRPEGLPKMDSFAWREEAIPTPGEGEVVVRTVYLSVDPYMRGRMNDTKSYVPPFALGEVLQGGVVGRVVASRHNAFAEGDMVLGMLGWQDYSRVNGKHLRKLDPSLAPKSLALGVLGMPGLTAYCGLLKIGEPKAGETVVVSGAAGAVGMIAGQIAKLKGCRVVGIAGSDEKTQYLKDECGFDETINYKTESSMREALRNVCKDGVDIYFDNVGGSLSDDVMQRINKGARIILCGQIAEYNLEKPDLGPRPQTLLLIRSALMKGFIVSDYAHCHDEAIHDLAIWYREGRIKNRETIVHGLEHAVDAFLGLFRGDNIGKQLVQVSDF